MRCCLLPNQTAGDRATLSGGRYPDTMDPDFMLRCGIWVENFSLSAVLDECLLWGHRDVIELFPNWDLNKKAQFCSLRTRGAFLADAACGEGSVTYVRITSGRGGVARLKNPWPRAVDENGRVYEGDVLALPLQAGGCVTLKQAGA